MLNQAQIIGNLGKDPEIRYMPNGNAVASFSIATTEKWKDKNTGEAKEQTEWHRISAFDKLAEIIGQYVKKGSLIYICGKIKTRKYASEMKMLGGRDGASAAPPHPAGSDATATRPSAPSRTAPTPSPSGFDDMPDDIPF